MPVEHFYVPWPPSDVHWSAELVRNGTCHFEGVDTGRILFVFDDDTHAAMAALAMPSDTETLRGSSHCGLLAPPGAPADSLVIDLREAGHEFCTLEVVTVDADAEALLEIDRILAALVSRLFPETLPADIGARLG